MRYFQTLALTFVSVIFATVGIAAADVTPQTPAGTEIILVVCKVADHQAPLSETGIPEGGWILDPSTCHEVMYSLINSDDPSNSSGRVTDFSDAFRCTYIAMQNTGLWQQANPGWLVVKVKCPRKDGTFPKDPVE